MKEQKLCEFFEWIEERHSISLKKTAGLPKPWTKDVIMQEYKFCNVFRRRDTVTKWVVDNVIHRWPEHPFLWFALCVSRRVNYIDTLSELDSLLVDWDAGEALRIMDNRKEHGLQIYNGAYMLTTGGRKVPKNEDSCYNIFNPLWENRRDITTLVNRADTVKEATEIFSNRYVGYSDFISYEVATDMTYSRYLKRAKDRMTWANAGPGASRGINRIYGRDIDRKIKPCQSNSDMQQLLSLSKLYLPDGFPSLEMRDIEHSLCEFDKYERIKSGKSTRMVKYQGV